MTGARINGDEHNKLNQPVDAILEESCASRLAQANLHRLRRQWDEANRVCLHVLYAAPDSWRAHALLGDIAAERGDADEAIRWYCMALDIRPDAQATRDKLSVIVNSRRNELNKTITTQIGSQLSGGASFSLMRTLASPSVRRGGIAAALGVIGIVGVCVLTAPLRTSQTEREIVEPAFSPTSTTYALDRSGNSASRINTGINPQPQTPALVTTLAAPTPTNSIRSSPAAQRAVPVSSADADETKLAASLQRDLSLSSLGVTIDNCVIDPSNQAAILTVSASSGEAGTQQAILASAEAVAKSALAQTSLPALQQCTVRYMAPIAGAQTIVFQGLAVKSGGELAQPNAPQTLALNSTPSIFSSTWWSPSFGASRSVPARAQAVPPANTLSSQPSQAPLNS